MLRGEYSLLRVTTYLESQFDCVDKKLVGHYHMSPARPIVICQVLWLPLVRLYLLLSVEHLQLTMTQKATHTYS